MQSKIKNQRVIVDRQQIIGRLGALIAEGRSKTQRRTKALEIFKQAYQAGYAEIRRRFESHGQGSEVVRENCFLVDQLVRLIHDFATEHEYPAGVATTGEVMSVVAVGGYGRGELAPQSDIDLLFVLPYKRTSHNEQIVEYILYMLWDLGLKVGHSTRSIDECIRQAKADMTIRTALLETRWIWGDQTLFADLKSRYRSDVAASSGQEFVESKLAERDERHAKLGEARYVLEPNIKEGKGGLRDLHTLYWIAKYLYGVTKVEELGDRGLISMDAANRFAKAQSFLWTVRCHLHFLAGREEDRLTFDVQQEISRRMGYTDHGATMGVERFMKHYFLIAKDVGDLTRIFCALIEAQNKRRPKLRFPALLRLRKVEGFRLEGNRLDLPGEQDLERDPIKMIRLFHAALSLDLDIHPHALSLVTQNLKRIDNKLRHDPEANRLFVEMLTSRKDPEVALRHMNEAGVLGRFVPDFGRVVAQMQYDMYHVYTVDEHTIQALGLLHRVEQGVLADELPIASEVVAKVYSRRALYLAVFLHDIAKGRNGDHSLLGADIALKLGPRLGLTDEETETASWLVRHHLLMTHTAFKRDIDDPKTISDFVAVVQSPERLKLLLVLTVADVRAVGPNVWNNWKGGLLSDLYHRALDMLSGGIGVERREARVEAAQVALREQLAPRWPGEEIDAHLARGYPAYWVSFDTPSHVRHAELIRQAETEQRPLTIDTRIQAAQGVTEVIIYTGDHAGLFAQIAGAMALSGASIVDAKIITMTNGMALDTFLIQDAEGAAFDGSSRLTKLTANLEQALAGRLRFDRELAKRRESLSNRTRVFKVPPRVLIDNKASAGHTVIEINGRDRIGLLYDITAAMTRLSLQIASAHISTYGERVVDVFYVKDVFGLKVEHERKISDIRDTLTTALGERPVGEAAGSAKTSRVSAAQ
ncbi:[protein-PII] uridylyltransferase [Telmatospirillum sp.]|uniref:[protein-PII] uridylyltransferase n=1 Tax=Telmatospirillum sp. TaxID=2079197 RepID=UPI00284BE251|nr:[protein-PII] uridylyltransferase [Telmatospirillum sp.]MDR3440404.1 [protein-PII] uridylyltransferase [Telmatospirillum sp.]